MVVLIPLQTCPTVGFPLTTIPVSPAEGAQDFSLQSLNVSPPPKAPSHPTVNMKTSSFVDTIEIAIEFVLALEHPCMNHIPYRDPPSADPANHMMMASTPLVARAPDAPQINQSWVTSGVIIKELLNLSSSINLEGEITPVEAWHRLHEHPDFWRLSRNQINQLKQELTLSVKCYGYVHCWPTFTAGISSNYMLIIDVGPIGLEQSWTRMSFGKRCKGHWRQPGEH